MFQRKTYAHCYIFCISGCQLKVLIIFARSCLSSSFTTLAGFKFSQWLEANAFFVVVIYASSTRVITSLLSNNMDKQREFCNRGGLVNVITIIIVPTLLNVCRYIGFVSDSTVSSLSNEYKLITAAWPFITWLPLPREPYSPSTALKTAVHNQQHWTDEYCTAQHCSTSVHSNPLHWTALHWTDEHCTAQNCNTSVHCTAMHCTALHGTDKTTFKMRKNI